MLNRRPAGEGGRRAAAVGALVGCLAAQIAPARASADSETTHTETLRASLVSEAQRARRWRYAWTVINGGLAIGSFALLPLSEPEGRPALVVGGIGSTISTVVTVVWPLDVEGAASNLDPGADSTSLESLRSAYARDERDRLRWRWHLLNVGVGVAYFAILGLGWDQWRTGAWAGLTAFAIGELQTLTQPDRLSEPIPADSHRPARLSAAPCFLDRGSALPGLALTGLW